MLAGSDQYSKDTWSLHCPTDLREDISDFKIALKLNDAACPVDQAYQDRLADFAEKLSKAGATVREVEPELDTKDYFDTYLTLLGAAMGFGVSADAVAAGTGRNGIQNHWHYSRYHDDPFEWTRHAPF